MRIIKKTGDVYLFLDQIKEGDKVFSFTDSKITPFGQLVKFSILRITLHHGWFNMAINSIQFIIFKNGYGSTKRTSTIK
jgi:hypothetical protein